MVEERTRRHSTTTLFAAVGFCGALPRVVSTVSSPRARLLFYPAEFSLNKSFQRPTRDALFASPFSPSLPSYALVCYPTLILVASSPSGLPQIGGERPDIDHSWPTEFQTLLRDCWSGDPSRRPEMSEVRGLCFLSARAPLWVAETESVQGVVSWCVPTLPLQESIGALSACFHVRVCVCFPFSSLWPPTRCFFRLLTLVRPSALSRATACGVRWSFA